MTHNKSTTKLTWLLFLNEACTWESKRQAEEFLSAVAGNSFELDTQMVRAISGLESYMRNQLSALHFNKPVDFDFINDRLKNIRLQMVPALDSAIPALRAQNNNSFEALLETLTFQFAHFLGQIEDGEAPYAVNRCEAICRKKAVEDCQLFYEKFRTLEDSWKSEIVYGLEAATIEDLERCADFFLATAGAKFCSDSCRFNSFALRKQLMTPSYQAEKQKRYRERQKFAKSRGVKPKEAE